MFRLKAKVEGSLEDALKRFEYAIENTKVSLLQKKIDVGSCNRGSQQRYQHWATDGTDAQDRATAAH